MPFLRGPLFSTISVEIYRAYVIDGLHGRKALHWLDAGDDPNMLYTNFGPGARHRTTPLSRVKKVFDPIDVEGYNVM